MISKPTKQKPGFPRQWQRGSQRAPQKGQDRVIHMVNLLIRANPFRQVALTYRTPFELLVATILSAQCTDQRVNHVTPKLFAEFRSPSEFAHAKPAVLERIIYPTGFYKAKARNLIRCGKALVERFHGRLPKTMEALVTLPGVGRKTANVVLGNAFEQPALVVDTHVKRVAFRLGLTHHRDPDKIELDLQHVIPTNLWTVGSHTLLLHGRYVCKARVPLCEACVIFQACQWAGKGQA